MKSINIEILMGHSIGISDSYYRATENEVLEDYLQAIDYLTTSKENKLKKEMDVLLEKYNNVDYALKTDIQEKDSEIRIMKEQFSKMQENMQTLSLHHLFHGRLT